MVVRAGDEPVARAAAAAAAGARAVLLADPRDRPLPAIPAGRIAAPVLGVTGRGRARPCSSEDAGATVEVGDVEAGSPPIARLPAPAAGAAAESPSATALSPFSSRGPAAGGGVKPDVAAPGAALTAVPGNAGAVVGGSAIAAARAAIEAARLARERPDAAPRELRAALVAGADPDPRLPARGAGAGAPSGSRRRPRRSPPRTTPGAPRGPVPRHAQACVRVVLTNQGATDAALALSLVADRGTEATLARPRVTIPPGGRREAEIDVRAAGPDGLAAGRLVARAEGGAAGAHAPVRDRRRGRPQPPPLGPLTVERAGGRVSGVRFVLGAFERGDPLGAGTRVALTERLALTLVDARGGRVVRRLTPPRGARELLPAEYAYTLPAGTLRALDPGRYAFRAVARSPRGGEPAVARSEPFSPVRTVTLYGRPGCHLCDDARAALHRVRAAHPFRLEEVDIETDDALLKRYLERIPVDRARRRGALRLLRRRGGAGAKHLE